MNEQRFKAMMAQHGDTQAQLAAAICLGTSNLNERIKGKVSFRQNEIAAIRNRYGLSAEEVDHVFFEQ